MYLFYHNSGSLSNQKLIFGVLEMPNQVSVTPRSLAPTKNKAKPKPKLGSKA